ncbi:Rha family transcriptional regulator [Deinococcus sp. YIM 77859]|uniref:Rha family transcriptional regulator n=1 Tax=Deinococcus sp. YIM 77859 TaxID=1540221 RepID=UPI00068BB103|nr:Rha family transcriptional regulator [Deinococcus sp. YIM 77859]
MTADIVTIQTVQGEARADSRDLARALGNQHKNLLSLIDDYLSDFQALGAVAFETRPLPGGGKPERFAFLAEDHCYFLLTLVRNSEQVVPLKRRLVQAFRAAREQAVRPAPLALPTDPLELLALSLQGLQQHREQITAIEHRLNTAPVRVSSELRARLHAGCQAFGKVHPRSFPGAYRAFKEAFGFAGAPLAAYDDLPQHRFDEAMTWLDVQTRTFRAQRPLLEQAGD